MPRTGKDALAGVLDRATKARTKSIQLKGMEFAGELAEHMLQHAGAMETLYSSLKAAVSDEKPSERKIAEMLQQVESKNKWFEKAEVG